MNKILVSAKGWKTFLLDNTSPARVPQEVVLGVKEALTILSRVKSYKELGAYSKFNPKPKHYPREGYRSINITARWRLLFKIINNNGETTILVDKIFGDHKY